MSKKKISEDTVPAIASSQIESKPRPLESVREMIGLVSAGAGIFAALLYLAGRSFASGYFAAMNIPSYQVSFSLWEYGEVAWIPLFLYPVVTITVSSFLGGVINIFFDWLLSPLLARFSRWLKNKIFLGSSFLRFPESSRETKLWFAISRKSFSALVLVFFAISTLQFVNNFGKVSGRLHILQDSAQIEITSTVPVAFDDDSLAPIKASGQDYYVYKGLHLLTTNNGKYYLFKEIDPVTCKPSKVYVVEARENLQINLLPAVSIADQCKSATGQNTNPAPVMPTANP